MRLDTRWTAYSQPPAVRGAALDVIREVLAERPGRSAPEAPLAIPTTIVRRSVTTSDRRHLRHRRRRSRSRALKKWVAGFALAFALAVGAITGSGAFDQRARYNAALVSAQQGETELYTVQEVHAHPAAAPKPQRSGSIREFLGMASAF